jgi:hypothetical protein
MKNEKKSQRGTQDFNIENPLQQREVKTTGASQQNFTISGVFTNIVGYLMMRLTLSGSLQGVYIGDSLAPLVRSWPLLCIIWINI